MHKGLLQILSKDCEFEIAGAVKKISKKIPLISVVFKLESPPQDKKVIADNNKKFMRIF